jgi:arylsulfatase A-like enzyme
MSAHPGTTIPPAMDGGAPARAVLLDVVRDLDGCALGHRGVLLDFGDPSMRGDLHPGTFARGDDEDVEHEGATWLRARSRGVAASFYWPGLPGDSADSNAYVEARLRGVSARSVSIAIDGKPVGSWPLGKGEPHIAMAKAGFPLTIGGHEVELRFSGGSRSQGEALAEVDWVHVGAGEPGEPYAAPTRADVLRDATAGGRSLRALALKAPGFVRCSGWVPANATLEAFLSTAGGGDAEVEARLVRDRKPPVVLGTARVAPGGMSWASWSVPVTGLDGDGALGAIELVATRSGKGTRLLLGEPRLVAAEPVNPPAIAQAKAVVLVVLGSTSPKALAPWGGPHPVPELTRVASSGTTFEAHRASSPLANSVLASILTGLPPRVHGLDDPDARLPAGVTTIEEACRQGGISTAMFTANPTTGAAFGFDRGWDAFVSLDPLEAAPGTQVFDDAAAWIDAHKGERFFLVLHARGGHPPWDVTPEELKQLPPDSYIGIVEPRRAAETLVKAKKHAGRFKEDDRVRAWALYDHALDANDAALGRLLAAIRAAGMDDDTAVIVTGDVGPSEAGPVPFIDADTLEESLLETPLVVYWPHAGAMVRGRVPACSSSVDLARTVVAMLGLPPPAGFQGVDLALQAAGAAVPAERPLAATRGDRFALRWGSFTFLGARDRETRLCDLSLDQACVADLRSTSPIALESLRRWTAENLRRTSPSPFPREPAVLDGHAKAALLRWGRPSDERDTEDDR